MQIIHFNQTIRLFYSASDRLVRCTYNIARTGPQIIERFFSLDIEAQVWAQWCKHMRSSSSEEKPSAKTPRGTKSLAENLGARSDQDEDTEKDRGDDQAEESEAGGHHDGDLGWRGLQVALLKDLVNVCWRLGNGSRLYVSSSSSTSRKNCFLSSVTLLPCQTKDTLRYAQVF